MLARHRESSPGIVGGSDDFSWNAWMTPLTSDSITPNESASCLGTGIAATVTPAPVSM
jgi:hypothetical protein